MRRGVVGVVLVLCVPGAVQAVPPMCHVYSDGSSGCEAWIAREPSSSGSQIFAIGPDVVVVLTGASLLAHDAASGLLLWQTPLTNTPGTEGIVSSDGKTLYVGGGIRGTFGYSLGAYDLATGAQRWATTYKDPALAFYGADSVALSGDGTTVFVAGAVLNVGLARSVVGAHDVATGARRWVTRAFADSPAGLVASDALFVVGGNLRVSRFNADTGLEEWSVVQAGTNPAVGIAIAPDGRTVYATGVSQPAFDYLTIALDAATGQLLWRMTLDGRGRANLDFEYPSAILVHPSGSPVYVTGTAADEAGNNGFATVAYDAATGAELWVSLYRGLALEQDYPNAMALSPDAARLAIVGSSNAAVGVSLYTTVVISAASGDEIQSMRYGVPSPPAMPGFKLVDGEAYHVTFGSDGNRLFVTGCSRVDGNCEAATLAYDVA